jgi:hypothetical protein
MMVRLFVGLLVSILASALLTACAGVASPEELRQQQGGQSPSSETLVYVQEAGAALAIVTQAETEWRGAASGETLTSLRTAVTDARATFEQADPPPACQAAHSSITESLEMMDEGLGRVNPDGSAGQGANRLDQAASVMALGRSQLASCILE